MADRGRLLAELFTAIDAMDSSAFIGKLTADAEFRFGAWPAVQGRAAIALAVDEFFSTIAGVNHEITKQIVDGNSLACEGIVTYTRHDATTVSLPFADVFEFDGELIRAYRIYIDIGPLYATTS